MSHLYDLYKQAYEPRWNWHQGDFERDIVPKSVGTAREEWLHAPALLLSDSDDDISETDAKPPQPLHERTEWDEVRHVRFKAALVREHNVTVGDHPACCDCLPMSLDWEHGDDIEYDINDYETMRTSSGRVERGQLEKLNYWERHEILQKSVCEMYPLVDEPQEPSIEVGIPSYERSNHCNPFAVFEGPSWGLLSDGLCINFPSMTVQVIDE